MYTLFIFIPGRTSGSINPQVQSSRFSGDSICGDQRSAAYSLVVGEME